MGFFRKSIKIILISFVLFVLLSTLSALIMYFTGIKEANSKAMIAISMVISAVFAGVLEAKIVGKKLLFVFLITTALFMAIVYGSLYIIFTFK